jgi:hypothetical protein
MSWEDQRREALGLLATMIPGDDFGVWLLAERDASGGQLTTKGTARPLAALAALGHQLADVQGVLAEQAARNPGGYGGNAPRLAADLLDIRARLSHVLVRAGLRPG